MEALFNNYKQAFDEFDAVRIASHYRLPCAVSDADGVLVFDNKDALIDKFRSNCKSMRAMGYVRSEFNILSELPMGSNTTAVNIGWRVQLERGDIEFRCLYICHYSEQHWQIFSANVFEGSFD